MHAIEHGRPASLGAYAAVAAALGLDPVFELVDPRRRSVARAEDPVHAAMGEAIARRLASLGFEVAVDDPFQHYQFAGRADVLGWSLERRALLHVENRTRFPNLQEAFGSYNAKRRYLPGVLAERIGLRDGWQVVTNVIAALWSSEVIHDLRLHPASFRAVCPNDAEAFQEWWAGQPPGRPGATSALVLFDPVAEGRSDRRRFVGLEAVDLVRGRYRGYPRRGGGDSGVRQAVIDAAFLSHRTEIGRNTRARPESARSRGGFPSTVERRRSPAHLAAETGRCVHWGRNPVA